MYRLSLFLILISLSLTGQQLPDGFTYVKNEIPDIILELRYCQDDNFVGETIDGYEDDVCILSSEATSALKKVQTDLKKKGYGLKIFDAYRPQQAVNHFVRWARDLSDKKMKAQYYPNEPKARLFKRGYIASKSGHSRGSTVDITLVDKDGKEVDMGTPWDFFSRKSWPSNTQITKKQQVNRRILREAMLKHGFKPLRTEWWHFTLINEPFPKTYFDFPVQ
ncbi:M15 family metallopeptidase [Spongiivirga citrea]|uniref:D-alanyl-D-alanine dipeptidase n=1 Tax=Spongiivirga citrea TaxID=1481457 RepID=A0A6M0CKR1_9FLAO|nr:M15 family metallopeptidase [Spongiivirga citrea]NER16027.1 peptidase M15 [Spongiivirga citrea]